MSFKNSISGNGTKGKLFRDMLSMKGKNFEVGSGCELHTL
jgi:hypothetical protein